MESTLYCTVCRQEIPRDRAKRNGVTCSHGCSKLRTAIKRDLRLPEGVCDRCGRGPVKRRVTPKMQGCAGQPASQVNQQSVCVDGPKSSGP